MMRLRACLVLAAFLFTACDHQKPVAPVQSASAATAQDDADLTGMPSSAANPSSKPAYPRAQLVSLPPAAPAPAVQPPAASARTSASTTEPAAPAPVAQTPPPEPTPAPAPVEPPPTPTIDSTARLSLNSSSPEPSSTATAEDTSKQEQVVVLQTSLGRIVIELDNSAAPVTCANFRKLVSDGFYDHTVFHRVIPDFIIQGGDPNSRSSDRITYGQGGPGYKLPAEIKLTHDLGAVAMARLPDSVNPKRQSNGSQFYICLEACPSLDAKYTVFGHVIRGMDVANKIGSAPRDSRDNPNERIEMEAHLESKRKALAGDNP